MKEVVQALGSLPDMMKVCAAFEQELFRTSFRSQQESGSATAKQSRINSPSAWADPEASCHSASLWLSQVLSSSFSSPIMQLTLTKVYKRHLMQSISTLQLKTVLVLIPCASSAEACMGLVSCVLPILWASQWGSCLTRQLMLCQAFN